MYRNDQTLLDVHDSMYIHTWPSLIALTILKALVKDLSIKEAFDLNADHDCPYFL